MRPKNLLKMQGRLRQEVLARAFVEPAELARQRFRIRRAHQGLADQDGVDPDPLELLELIPRR